MKEKQKNVIIPALAAGFVFLAYLVMAALCIHDMQSAEGVGLLFALRAGKDRLWYDVAADSLGVLGLLLLVVVPCFRLGHRSAAALLRMLLAFLSFMPSLSMAYLLHPLEGGEELQLQQPLFLLQTLLPFLCLWAAVLGRETWKGWYGFCAGAAVLLFVTGFPVPSLQPLLQFVMTYLLLLAALDLWERVWKKYPALNVWGWLLFGGLGFRAFYVLSRVMGQY